MEPVPILLRRSQVDPFPRTDRVPWPRARGPPAGVASAGNTLSLKGGDFMRRFVLAALLALALMALAVPAAWAGSPHFVGAPTVTVQGATLTVHAKEAGLGDEAQIEAVLSGTADCINNGGNHPKAVNKTSFQASSVVPVQNGKAEYDISVTATFSPSCSPPMTVQFPPAALTDTTNNLSVKLI
jgi:hypothetical protein